MSLVVKVHSKDGRTIVAVCDKELLGQVIEENGKQLDLKSPFFQGVEMEQKEVGDLIRNADGVNLVGEQAVKIGLQEEIIEEKHILRINDIPYAQAALITD